MEGKPTFRWRRRRRRRRKDIDLVRFFEQFDTAAHFERITQAVVAVSLQEAGEATETSANGPGGLLLLIDNLQAAHFVLEVFVGGFFQTTSKVARVHWVAGVADRWVAAEPQAADIALRNVATIFAFRHLAALVTGGAEGTTVVRNDAGEDVLDEGIALDGLAGLVHVGGHQLFDGEILVADGDGLVAMVLVTGGVEDGDEGTVVVHRHDVVGGRCQGGEGHGHEDGGGGSETEQHVGSLVFVFGCFDDLPFAFDALGNCET